MKIRKAKIDDYENIINLYKQLHDEETKYDENIIDNYIVDKKQAKIIKDKIKSKKEIFLIAEVDKKIVGLIDGYIFDSIYYKDKISILEHICVDKEYRNKKIATSLINEFSEKSKKKGAKYIRLFVFDNNDKATNLYKKLGFTDYIVYYNKKI